MPVTTIEVIQRLPFANGDAFDGHRYERVDGIANYAVDPAHSANSAIVDLDLAPRDDDGLVRFSGDVTLLVPEDGGNGMVLLDLPNRGHRVAPRMFNMGPILEDDEVIDPGDGWLFNEGWTLAFVGWQWDVPRVAGRMGLAAPLVLEPIGGEMQLRFQPPARTQSLPLTDQHVGSIGNHLTIPPADWQDPNAKLLVRDGIWGDTTVIPRDDWHFTGQGEHEARVVLDDGFEAGRLYDVVYVPQSCPVVGAGLLALRDMAIHLKQDSVTAVRQVIGEGVSQCGRCLRTFVYHGLNTGEAGEKAFDGLLIHVAGGRRGEFNFRYAQPSVQPTPGFGHLFPHADAPLTSTLGETAGLLDAQARDGNLPKIIYTDTAAEYWRGDAGLAHTDTVTGADVALPKNARRYLFASTQHGSGLLPAGNESPFGTGANDFNLIDYRPLIRAALQNLRSWLQDDVVPPPSVYPRLEDKTASSRTDVLTALAARPELALPDPTQLNCIRPLDLGPDADQGIGRYPAVPIGDGIEGPVSSIDEDGNETGGVRMPDVTVPVGVHTGFCPRHPDIGGEGMLLEYLGSTALFDREEILRRYASREDYRARIVSAAEELVSVGYLRRDDIDLCVHLALERFDAAVEPA